MSETIQDRFAASSESNIQARWNDAIAIIGMSARFPGARNLEEFWTRILAGESLISDLSEPELRAAGIDDKTLRHPEYVRRGTTIEEAECFDAKFFGLSRRDAEIMDPQQRVFLESAWHAMEDAGYTGDGARVGVYAGVGINSYVSQLLQNPSIVASAGGYQLMLANDKDFIATRVAYKMNLRGPAVSIQTACSTSLAAVHLACQGILAGECEMALAGGVSIAFPQGTGYQYLPGMILSPDGYCRPFDREAKGTVPGRGCGVVVLKRFSQALADGDTIYAVIRGSAWNNDGSGKIGYTAPSVDGQASVIRQAQQAAGVEANRVRYVETHGTGTELGDPIEVAALTEVFREGGAAAGSCVLGAVKANMGHADVAAGVAGLIKAALALHARVVPPTPNFRQPNPDLVLEKGPFFVSADKVSLPAGECWASVSSFGIGGTNVHAVLSSAPQTTAEPGQRSAQIFPVSAKTATALSKVGEQLADYLESNPTLDIAAVAATLQMGRRAFDHRRAWVAKDLEELVLKLRTPAKPRAPDASLAGNVVFLFPGQGQQFAGMCAGLERTDAAFRKILRDGACLLREEFSIDITGILSDGNAHAELKEKATETSLAQPALFLVEYALAQRWRTLGVEPAALLGHSLGELVAAAVAGVFSFEDGLRLAAERGRLMADTPEGAMLAVMLPPEALLRNLAQDVWLAAENGPKLSVASGLPPAIEKLERKLAAQRIASVRLASRNAFHTPLMAEAAHGFRKKVAGMQRKAPAIPWLSNVTGTWIDSGEAQNPQYWANHILARVRFSNNLAALAESPRLLLEVGPGEALIGAARSQAPGSIAIPSLGAENRRKTDDLVFLEAAAQLWQNGVPLKWNAFEPQGRRRRIPLPPYPFEREHYWIDAAPAAPVSALPPVAELREKEAEKTAKQEDITSWFYTPAWQSTAPPAIALGGRSASTSTGWPLSWMILLDRSGTGRLLAERLRGAGCEVITVQPSEEFAGEGDSFSINPRNLADYGRLWQQIGEQGLTPKGVIDLWTMCGEGIPAFDSLVALLQSARAQRRRLERIEIVTENLEQVLDEQLKEVDRAEVLGLLRVVPHEFPGTQCRSIDVARVSAVLIEQERIADLLAEEVRFSGPNLAIAYRAGKRWQKQWTPAPLPSPAVSPFKQGGVYLVTGGVGGIGFVLARHLAREYQARIALVGRTRLPETEAWDAWLGSHTPEDPVSRRIQRMRALGELSSEVSLIAADVADPEAMSAAIEALRERYGRIDGVIHAAGLSDVSLIGAIDLPRATALREPKVAGSIVLADLLKGMPLDFFLLCSSISTVQPAAGQGAYASANAFQNHFAAYCRQEYGLPAVAIAFDGWREVGMAADNTLPEGFEHLREAFESVKEAQMRTAIAPDEGIEIVRRVLASKVGPLILTSTVLLEAREGQDASFVTGGGGEPVPSSRPGAREDAGVEVEGVIAIWRDLLANPAIGPDDNFFEIGGHSLLGTMVLSRIRDRFGLSLNLRTLFESPTPQSLAERIRTLGGAAVAEGPVSALVEEREEFEI